MEYRKTYKSETDAEVLRHLPASPKSGPFSDSDVVNWLSISQLQQKTGMGVDTIRTSLRRLCEAGRVHRAWDGNERFGRYVHARRAERAR
jgi:hypothetical protein